MKNDSPPFAAPSCPVAAAPLPIAATPLRPVHLLPLVKGRNNESFLKLRVYGAPNRICRPCDHLFSMQSFFLRSAKGSVFYAIVLPPFCQKAVKQMKRIVHLNDSTFPYKGKRNETKRNDYVILSHTVPFHIHYQLTVSRFTLFAYPFSLIFQIYTLLHVNVEVRGMCLRIVYA